jgi:hypothetical protein
MLGSLNIAESKVGGKLDRPRELFTRSGDHWDEVSGLVKHFLFANVKNRGGILVQRLKIVVASSIMVCLWHGGP